MSSQTLIYHAAALFSGRETFFNIALTSRLKQLGYPAILPQRDGFEFGGLERVLSGKLAPNEVPVAVQAIIYFLDMGEFIPKSTEVVANLDEPLDEGVLVEISYAKLMGKPVVGYRTDARSPFGRITDPLGGLHFFPAYQCDVFISHLMPCPSYKEAEAQLSALADKIVSAISSLRRLSDRETPPNPIVSRTVEGARLLFDGIEDIHSPDGLQMIAERYMKHHHILNKVGPQIQNSAEAFSRPL